jgi:hypothetical protein
VVVADRGRDTLVDVDLAKITIEPIFALQIRIDGRTG